MSFVARIRVRTMWESLRATFWAVPSAMVTGAVALSFGIVQLDEAASPDLLERLSWVYTGGPEGARAVLSTIAASMITVAGVTFSITIVALTLASQQFGPRLLRNFLRDRGNQIVLGTFVSTFLYCLLVLRTVRGNDGAEFVPNLAVTFGVFLALLSLGVLIYFIHHVSVSIQASHIIANVSNDLDEAIARMFPERIGQGETDAGAAPGPAPPFEDAWPVEAAASGYVQAVDGARIMQFAAGQDLVVRLAAQPGDFVREGAPLMHVAGASRTPDGAGELRKAFSIGVDRTGTQDVTFFVEQLVELAVRALSPGINDPGTARLSIDRLEQALCQLAMRRMPSPYRFDEHGALRVLASPVTFRAVAGRAFEEIGRYGCASVSVTCRLLEAARALAPCLRREEDRLVLERLVADTAARARVAVTGDADRDRIDACASAAAAALAAFRR